MRDDPSASVTRGVELILREIDALPTLPSVASRLLSLSADENADVREIAAVLSTDPSLTARVLSLCNSAAAGQTERVMSVDRAIVLLGQEAVRALALSVQVVEWSRQIREAKNAGSSDDGGFDFEGYWRHCVGVACASELLCRAQRKTLGNGRRGPKPEEAFTAGLLSGLGKAALAVILPRAYRKVLDLADKDGAELAWCERTLLGIDHRVAGKRLGQRWGLPSSLVDVMWLTGVDEAALPDTVDKALIALVRSGRSVCARLHIGWSGEGVLAEVGGSSEREAERLGLRAEVVEAALEPLARSVSDRCKSLGLGEQTESGVLLRSVLAANRTLGKLHVRAGDRARHADARARALRAVSHFCQHASRRPGLESVVTEIGASATWLLSGRSAETGVTDEAGVDAGVRSGAVRGGRLIAIVQSRSGGPWELARFDDRGACVSYDVTDGLCGTDGRWFDLTDVACGRAPGVGDGRSALVRWSRAHAGLEGQDEGFWLVTLPMRDPRRDARADAGYGGFGGGGSGGGGVSGDRFGRSDCEWLVLPAPSMDSQYGGYGNASAGRGAGDDYGMGFDRMSDGHDAAVSAYTPDGCGASMVLLREPGGVVRPVDELSMTAAVSAWSAAFAGAAWWEASARLGEELARRSRELVATREQLAESESFARLGEMAAGAAHEMNNPLTVILGRAQWLANNVSTREHRAPARAIVEAARELSELIVRMHEIASPRLPKNGSSQLAALLQSAVEQARGRVRERLERRGALARGVGSRGPGPGEQAVTIQADDDLAGVMVDEQMCRDALAEVVANALEAQGCSDVFVRARVEEDRRRLLVSVADNGAGMDERTLRHAFDPFFSAKPAGRQTGLGLATARRLLKSLGGTIRLHSVAGTGTTAMLTVPLSSAEGVNVGGADGAGAAQSITPESAAKRAGKATTTTTKATGKRAALPAGTTPAQGVQRVQGGGMDDALPSAA